MALGKNPWAANAAPARRLAPLLGVDMLCLLEPVLFDHEAETAGSLFRPLYSLCTHRGAAYPEEPGEAPSSKAPSWKSSPGCDLDIPADIDASHVADSHQHTYVLRSQPHRIVGALVVALQEQHAQAAATTQVLRDAIPRIVPEDQHGARERAPARRLPGR